MKEKLKTALRLDRAVRLVWTAAPGWTEINVGLVLLQGLLPLVSLYLLKRIVDAVVAGFSLSDKAIAVQHVLFWLLLAAAVALVSSVCRSLAELSGEAQSLAVTDAVSDILHAQSVAVDLEYYEDPAYHDTLHRAQQEAPYRPTRLVNGLVQVGQNAVSLAGVAVLLFSLNWVIGVVLLVAAVPAALARILAARRLYGYEQKQAETERHAWYYHWMLTDSEHAKEVRLFNLGGLFAERFRGLRQGLRAGRLGLSRRRALNDLAAQLVATAAVFGTFGYVSYQAVLGTITLGSVVMYYQGFQIGLGFLQGILRGLAGLYEDNLFLGDLYRFLDLKPRVQAPARPRPVPAPFRRGLACQGVSFGYSGSSRQALEKIDLTLAPGEVIALVGENGSGKTTLAKLLCRLYDPAAGTIAIDGIDLRDLDPIEWRRNVTVIFQDYLHYQMTAAENIWLGNVDRQARRSEIVRAAGLSGADTVIARLPRGYDTPLGHWFNGGQELSIGEWQKVALARAFFRDAKIVILDEPTSGLDPLAEAELLHHFRRLIASRSAILISHRLSTVRMADRIYVLDQGRIVERGTHETLLATGGAYARLYRAQADQYGQSMPVGQAQPPPGLVVGL